MANPLFVFMIGRVRSCIPQNYLLEVLSGVDLLPSKIKAKYFIPVLVGLDLFSGVTGYPIFGSGIAHFAHVGGALFGFIMMWYWKKNQFNRNRWDL